MVSIENLTPVANLNPQGDKARNRWVLNNDFVFVVVTAAYRKRIVIPARTAEFKAVKVRRMRARLVRGALLAARKQAGALLSWKEIDDAYIGVLRADKCSGAFLRLVRVGLTLRGIGGSLWRYWRVPEPAAKSEPSA